MSKTPPERRLFSAREAAERLGTSRHCVLAVARRLNIGTVFSKYRGIDSDEIPELERGLLAAGFIKRPMAGA